MSRPVHVRPTGALGHPQACIASNESRRPAREMASAQQSASEASTHAAPVRLAIGARRTLAGGSAEPLPVDGDDAVGVLGAVHDDGGALAVNTG